MIYSELKYGLGNIMFQYAFCRVLQLEYGDSAICDYSGGTSFGVKRGLIKPVNNPLYGFKLSPNVLFSNNVKYPFLIKEKRFFIFIFSFFTRAFSKIINNKDFQLKIEHLFQPYLNYFGIYYSSLGWVPMNYCSKSKKILAEGNYLSPQYFIKYERLLKEEFSITLPIDDKNKEMILEIENNNSICVHVRKGDYCNPRYDMLNVCSTQYYYNAMKKMSELVDNPVFYIFTNDFDWVANNLLTDSFKCRFVDINLPENPIEELRLMKSCKHFILSNSSFCWWGQFLSDNSDKNVICPMKYVKGKNNNSLQSGLVEKKWIRIRNF